MDYYDQLKNTVMAASKQGAGAPILGGAPELEKYYDINFQMPLSNAGIKALAGQTGTENANTEAAIKERIAQIKDQADPSNFRREQKPDGGYAFYDGAGKEISASQYASALGKSTVDVLTDSQNPIDLQYTNDYDNLQTFLNAVTTGDKETTEAFYAENPQLKRLAPADVLKEFKRAYPTVYGTTNTGQRLGSTFIPSTQSVEDRVNLGRGTGIGE